MSAQFRNAYADRDELGISMWQHNVAHIDHLPPLPPNSASIPRLQPVRIGWLFGNAMLLGIRHRFKHGLFFVNVGESYLIDLKILNWMHISQMTAIMLSAYHLFFVLKTHPDRKITFDVNMTRITVVKMSLYVLINSILPST
jgi:hypothetical protein